MPKFSVMFARFPFKGVEHPDVTDWLVTTVLKAKADPRISDVYRCKVDDTPITASRNRAAMEAQKRGADFLVMIDSDMKPDYLLGQDPLAKPFWDHAFNFVIGHYGRGPCVVGVPYCGPPPHENVYVFRFANRQSNHPNPDWQLNQFSREESAQRTGFEQVGALPTGLVLVDMRAFGAIAHPYFDYEWVGDQPPCPHCHQAIPGPRAYRASTEDVYWSRNLNLAGVPQYCFWDAWAVHHKSKEVGKPELQTIDNIRGEFVEAVRRGQDSRERVLVVGESRLEVPTHDRVIITPNGQAVRA